MTAAPALSICVINHNYGRFLADAIDSALDQDGTPTEVVVVDDGSSDDSRTVIASYAGRIGTVMKDNGGQGSAFNAAIEASSGEALLFLDADDMLTPGIAAAVVGAFRDDPEVVKVQFRMRIVDESGQPTGVLLPPREGILPSGDLRAHVLRYRSYPWPPSSAMAYRRTALAQLGPIPEERFFTGACDAWLSELLPLLGKIRSLDAVGASYRRHGANDFAGTEIRPAWLRHKIELTRRAHSELVELGRTHGVTDIPVSAEEALDAAYAGFRVASMVLEPAAHPVPGDGRPSVAWRGCRSVLQNPFFGPRQRLSRTAWFVLAGLLPRRLARRVVGSWVPDGPQPPPWQRPRRGTGQRRRRTSRTKSRPNFQTGSDASSTKPRPR